MKEVERLGEESAELSAIGRRFANCSALVSGLTRHQLQRTGEKQADWRPGWMADTISTLNLLQQRIARPGRDGAVLQAYLRDAAEHWNGILKDRGISVRAEAADHLRIDEAAIVTLAVVGQELIASAVDHAFEDRSLGVISLRLGPVRFGAWELSVADDGGKAAGAARRGLSLVHRLAESLGGTCEVCDGSHGRGTVVRVVFPSRMSSRATTSDTTWPRAAATTKGQGPLSGRQRAGRIASPSRVADAVHPDR